MTKGGGRRVPSPSHRHVIKDLPLRLQMYRTPSSSGKCAHLGSCSASGSRTRVQKRMQKAAQVLFAKWHRNRRNRFANTSCEELQRNPLGHQTGRRCSEPPSLRSVRFCTARGKHRELLPLITSSPGLHSDRKRRSISGETTLGW